MTKTLNFIKTALPIILFYILIIPREASAYLDAGTGSYIIQMILAAFAGSLFFIKSFWFKLISFVKKKSIKQEETIQNNKDINNKSDNEPKKSTN